MLALMTGVNLRFSTFFLLMNRLDTFLIAPSFFKVKRQDVTKFNLELKRCRGFFVAREKMSNQVGKLR